MSRTLHDEFAKDWMKEFLSDFGKVETEFPISGEVRSVDVYFEPNLDCLPAPIGQLGQMIQAPCLIEPFRNAIPGAEICNCRSKATILGYKLLRQSQKSKLGFQFRHRPFLWMISPTLSHKMQRDFCMQQQSHWGEGIYFLPKGDRAAVIAVHQLPKTLETLWLRLLGRGRVQQQAIAELMALPPDHPYRNMSLRHIAVLQKNLMARQNLSKDLREVTMTLAITYEQIEAELIQKGIEQGVEQGIEQGQHQRSLEIAKALLAKGLTPQEVAQVTQLEIDQLPSTDAD